MTSSTLIYGLATALLLASASAARAAGPADPDWPCQQRLVPELSAGQLWAGKPLAELPADAALAPALQPLPERLASRDLVLEQAGAQVEQAIGQIPEADREQQRALLFRATLTALNGARDHLIAGIKRYARAQHGLADRITAEGRELVTMRKDPAQAAAVDDASNARAWDMRIFDDRQRTQRTLCDQPVQLEQRAFALARLIQGTTP